MSDDVYVCMQQESKKLIVNAYMTYQKKRGAKHVVQSWQQYHFEAKEFTRKITHKGKYMSIFDHFQKDYVFHASQRQHDWTDEWCKKICYVRTVNIAHHAPPEQRERYVDLYRYQHHPKFMLRGRNKKSRTDYHETSRAIVSMNREAGQNPEIVSKGNKCRDDLYPEKIERFVWLPYLEMEFRGQPTFRKFGFHTVAISRIDRQPSHGYRAVSSEENGFSPSHN